MPGNSFDWLWHWLGYAVALASLGVVVWALFWDRARGRQRCRKCFYDLRDAAEPSAESPVTCPECGKAHTKPKHMTKTHRRLRWAGAGVLAMVVSGYGLWVVPDVTARGWRAGVPTPVLLVLSPWLIVHYGPVDLGNPREFQWDKQSSRGLTQQKRQAVNQWLATANRVSNRAPAHSLGEELWTRTACFGPTTHSWWYMWVEAMQRTGLARDGDPANGRHVSGDLRGALHSAIRSSDVWGWIARREARLRMYSTVSIAPAATIRWAAAGAPGFVFNGEEQSASLNIQIALQLPNAFEYGIDFSKNGLGNAVMMRFAAIDEDGNTILDVRATYEPHEPDAWRLMPRGANDRPIPQIENAHFANRVWHAAQDEAWP
ncbi:MAG: hypothetical protein AAGF47_09495 [Planctomycetota bacterium]